MVQPVFPLKGPVRPAAVAGSFYPADRRVGGDDWTSARLRPADARAPRAGAAGWRAEGGDRAARRLCVFEHDGARLRAARTGGRGRWATCCARSGVRRPRRRAPRRTPSDTSGLHTPAAGRAVRASGAGSRRAAHTRGRPRRPMPAGRCRRRPTPCRSCRFMLCAFPMFPFPSMFPFPCPSPSRAAGPRTSRARRGCV